MARTVADHLRELGHARNPEIEALRAIVRAAVPEAVEQVKWNAPSCAVDGDHRITFRLRPGDRVQLVLHRGTVDSPDDLDRKAKALGDLARRWVDATRDRA